MAWDIDLNGGLINGFNCCTCKFNSNYDLDSKWWLHDTSDGTLFTLKVFLRSTPWGSDSSHVLAFYSIVEAMKSKENRLEPPSGGGGNNPTYCKGCG